MKVEVADSVITQRLRAEPGEAGEIGVQPILPERRMETFIQLTVILVSLVALAEIAALLSRRFGIPAPTVQLLTGVLLGPSLLNLLGAPIVLGTWGSVSPVPFHAVLKALAEVGLIQLMFVAGLQMDWLGLKKVLHKSFSIGSWGFALVAAGVAIVSRLFTDRWAEALGVSAIMASSSFGISVYNFGQMKLLGLRISMVILGAAVLSALLAILLMVASLAVNYAEIHGAFKMSIAVSWFLGKLIMFFTLSYFLASRFLSLSARGGLQKKPLQMLIGYLLLIAAIYAWGSIHFGSFAAVVIASLGGALLSTSNPDVKEKIEKGFGSIIASLPIGLLFVVLGMEVNLKVISGYKVFLAVLLATVIGTKLIGPWIGARKTSEPLHHPLVVSIGVLPQGEMGILIAAYLFSRGLIEPSSFNVAIVVVVILTMLTPVLMRIAYAHLQAETVRAGSGSKSRARL